MRRYQDGHSHAFDELYRRHSGRVYAFLRVRLRNQEEVDEVFQGVFMKLHHSRRSYQAKYPFTAWLFTIARTTLFDHLRKKRREVETVDDTEQLNQIAAEEQRSEIDTSRIDALSEEQRTVVSLRVLEERSYAEIATLLGRTEGSVRQILSRTLRKLKMKGRES